MTCESRLWFNAKWQGKNILWGNLKLRLNSSLLFYHKVLKPDSKTTPLRSVLSTHPHHSWDKHWKITGQRKLYLVLDDLLTVLLNFLHANFATAWNISKMFNAVRICLFDQHNHWFLWKDITQFRKLNFKNTFGNPSSGAIAATALRKTAKMFEVH